ncbi:uncharacterized protein LOC119189842 [Manduca sexta]|uniref:uncharacterized protein LOC119189842 n=1 Tax=Manduca sexta TaxID=7130 RepID=UPI00188E6FF8|nr:uncharacterized protein LOC119189842 [Manduca sexta]
MTKPLLTNSKSLNEAGFHTVGYVDDVAILIKGKFVGVLCDLMQGANPSKTELVLFTRKRTTENFRLPKLQGTTLSLTKEVKYLGVILDDKLLWNKHLDHKLEKACITFWQCKRLLGKTWGVHPKIPIWLYTAVVRPITTYGAVVWWPRTKLSTARNKLQQFQRLACTAITGCMKTTPTAALEVLLGLPPLDLFIQQEAASAAVRLKTLKLWGTAIGAHAEILVEAINYKPLMAAPNDRVPKQYIFGKNYTVRLAEEQHDWSGTHELRIYTDGSKTRTGSGAGVFSPEINIKISMALGAHNSIYQCECVAITEAAKAVEKRGLIGHKIRIVSDSAAVLRALDSKTIQSGLILECHQALEGIGKTNSVTLQWIQRSTVAL